LLSGSEYSASLLAANPDWLGLFKGDGLRYPRRKQGFKQELTAALESLRAAGDFPGAFNGIRRFRQRETLRVGARDLANLGTTVEVILELSDLADVCLDAVWSLCLAQAKAKFGTPYEQDTDGRWRPSRACVLGMGKLGGQELNYSSDVDVLFVYSDEGEVFREPPDKVKSQKPVVKNHLFFNRLAEAFIGEVSRMSPTGTLYRIDLRLRPEGDQGPLSRSLASYENYYAQWGQTWERMMLIKARGVAGDVSRVSRNGTAIPLSPIHQPQRAARGGCDEGSYRA
jgi:glutamate-ammonia-ligase adenylyltransferase